MFRCRSTPVGENDVRIQNMTTELKNYAGTFDKVTIKGNTLILRFHNGYAFDLKSEKPIILITAHECINIDSVYRDLARFESEEVDGLTIDNMADTSRIIIDFCWANDGSPYELCTEKVSVTYEQYNIDDYQEYYHLGNHLGSDQAN